MKNDDSVNENNSYYKQIIITFIKTFIETLWNLILWVLLRTMVANESILKYGLFFILSGVCICEKYVT